MSVAEIKSTKELRREILERFSQQYNMKPIIELINSFEAGLRGRLDKWLLSQTCLADEIHDCKTDKEKNRKKLLELRYKYREETVGELRRLLEGEGGEKGKG